MAFGFSDPDSEQQCFSLQAVRYKGQEIPFLLFSTKILSFSQVTVTGPYYLRRESIPQTQTHTHTHTILL